MLGLKFLYFDNETSYCRRDKNFLNKKRNTEVKSGKRDQKKKLHKLQWNCDSDFKIRSRSTIIVSRGKVCRSLRIISKKHSSFQNPHTYTTRP